MKTVSQIRDAIDAITDDSSGLAVQTVQVGGGESVTLDVFGGFIRVKTPDSFSRAEGHLLTRGEARNLASVLVYLAQEESIQEE